LKEVVIRLEVPEELVQEFKLALNRFLEEIKANLILFLLEKSKLSEEDVIEIGDLIKYGIAKRHGL
jgi:hypothetical protein